MPETCEPGLQDPTPVGGRLDKVKDAVTPELFQNKPNPFYSGTEISFYLPNDGKAELVIYDVTGKELKSVKGMFDAGYHEIEIERNELPSYGVYFYTLRTGSFMDTKQMILLE